MFSNNACNPVHLCIYCTLGKEVRSCANLAHICIARADQNTGSALLEFPVRNAMQGKSRVSSAIKYDLFKLDDSGNCLIRKT